MHLEVYLYKSYKCGIIAIVQIGFNRFENVRYLSGLAALVAGPRGNGLSAGRGSILWVRPKGGGDWRLFKSQILPKWGLIPPGGTL